jgi:hypothetical protein
LWINADGSRSLLPARSLLPDLNINIQHPKENFSLSLFFFVEGLESSIQVPLVFYFAIVSNRSCDGKMLKLCKAICFGVGVFFEIKAENNV